MASHPHGLRYLCSILGYLLPVAARFLPVTLNTSLPVVSPEALETIRTIPMQIDLSVSTLIPSPLASSALSSLSTTPCSTTIVLISSSQLSTTTSDYITNSTGLTTTQSSSGPSILTSEYLASGAGPSTISTIAIISSLSSESSMPRLEYSTIIGPNTDPNSTPTLLLTSSLLPTHPTKSPPWILASTELPTPITPSSLNATSLGLIVGFSIFGVALLVGLLVAGLKKRCTSRHGRKETHWKIPSSPTSPRIQFEINRSPGSVRGRRIMTLQPDCVKNVEAEEIQAPEVRHRIKSPRLEAWKKGVVPNREPPAKADHDDEVVTKEPEGSTGRAT